jgi:hypothetical protein
MICIVNVLPVLEGGDVDDRASGWFVEPAQRLDSMGGHSATILFQNIVRFSLEKYPD